MPKPKAITTRVDMAAQPPFKKQPPSFPDINYDQVLYTVHIQFEWQEHCVRFIGYLSPGTPYIEYSKLDPLGTLSLSRLLVNDKDGKYLEDFPQDAPLMKTWYGDKQLTIKQLCEELGIQDRDINVFTQPGNAATWGLSTDYEDTPEHKDLAELHEQVIPLMIKHGLGTVKLLCEDGQVALVAMYPLGLALADVPGFCKAMAGLVGDRHLRIRAHGAGGSTFDLHKGDKHVVQTFPSFMM
jgi:hypothetical protein